MFCRIASVAGYNCALRAFIRLILNIYPRNLALYRLACRHKSRHVVITKHAKISNERLEFIGDAVLNAIVADMLFRRYPLASEGFLTQFRARIVNRNSLNNIAERLCLSRYVIYGRSFDISHPKNIGLLGNVLEALFGAIYLDRGYNVAYKVIETMLETYLDLNKLAYTETNYKSRLLEYCQKYNKIMTFDFQESTTKSAPFKFTVKVYIEDECLATGEGNSKKQAQNKALERVYNIIK